VRLFRARQRVLKAFGEAVGNRARKVRRKPKFSMNWTNRGDENAELDALFQAYRAACPDPDASANFMPELWRRIEERQRSVFFMDAGARPGNGSRRAVPGDGGYLYIPHGRSSVFSVESYVEALAAGTRRTLRTCPNRPGRTLMRRSNLATLFYLLVVFASGAVVGGLPIGSIW